MNGAQVGNDVSATQLDAMLARADIAAKPMEKA